MMRKPTKKSLKKRADKLWADKVKEKGYCEAIYVSECKGILNACHIIRRGNNAVRYDLENGISLCIKHHYWFDKGDKFEVTEWFNEKYPGRKERLDKKNIIVHFKKHHFEEIVKELTIAPHLV